jgi:hypothetical protein
MLERLDGSSEVLQLIGGEAADPSQLQRRIGECEFAAGNFESVLETLEANQRIGKVHRNAHIRGPPLVGNFKVSHGRFKIANPEPEGTEQGIERGGLAAVCERSFYGRAGLLDLATL